MAITANKQKHQKDYIREGAFAYLQTVITNSPLEKIEHKKSPLARAF